MARDVDDAAQPGPRQVRIAGRRTCAACPRLFLCHACRTFQYRRRDGGGGRRDRLGRCRSLDAASRRRRPRSAAPGSTSSAPPPRSAFARYRPGAAPPPDRPLGRARSIYLQLRLIAERSPGQFADPGQRWRCSSASARVIRLPLLQAVFSARCRGDLADRATPVARCWMLNEAERERHYLAFVPGTGRRRQFAQQRSSTIRPPHPPGPELRDATSTSACWRDVIGLRRPPRAVERDPPRSRRITAALDVQRQVRQRTCYPPAGPTAGYRRPGDGQPGRAAPPRGARPRLRRASSIATSPIGRRRRGRGVLLVQVGGDAYANPVRDVTGLVAGRKIVRCRPRPRLAGHLRRPAQRPQRRLRLRRALEYGQRPASSPRPARAGRPGLPVRTAFQKFDGHRQGNSRPISSNRTVAPARANAQVPNWCASGRHPPRRCRHRRADRDDSERVRHRSDPAPG